MAHKNLLDDPWVKEEAYRQFEKKKSRCWAMKKVRFLTNEAALEAAVYENRFGRKLYSYKCEICNFYHLTKELK